MTVKVGDVVLVREVISQGQDGPIHEVRPAVVTKVNGNGTVDVARVATSHARLPVFESTAASDALDARETQPDGSVTGVDNRPGVAVIAPPAPVDTTAAALSALTSTVSALTTRVGALELSAAPAPAPAAVETPAA